MRRGRVFGAGTGLALIGLAWSWCIARPAIAAGRIDDELYRDTQRLVDIARRGDEDGGPSSPPIMVHVNCDYTHQWLSQRCEYNEALVPFDTYGPGSGSWQYVALFMLPPAEAATDAETRQETGRRPKHVVLVEFKLVSKPFGMIEWPTARVVDGHVLVRTRHWIAGDGHMDPSGPGTVRIDLPGGMRLTNLPADRP